MFWRKKKDEELVLNLVEEVIRPILFKKLNEPNETRSGASYYSIRVEKKKDKKENYIIFRIRRVNSSGTFDFTATFVLSFLTESVLEIEEYESDELKPEEYSRLQMVLEDIFGDYRIVEWYYGFFGGYYDASSHQKIKIH